MSRIKILEISVGVFVAFGLGALFVLAMKVSNLSAFANEPGYAVEARFDNIGSLKERAAVTMAGVLIGRVDEISFDDETYEAVVKLKIYRRFAKIPKDSSASILTAGLLGEQYVAVEPGGSFEYLAAGDTFKFSQSALILENMIGQFLFNTAAGDNE